MEIVVSINHKELLYQYVDMGVHYFILGCPYSFYTSYALSIDDIKEITMRYPQCHFYVALNALYDQHQMNEIEEFIKALHNCCIHGLLFQDFGILQIVKELHYDFDMMYAPETLNTNSATLNTLMNLGVKSAFLSRVIPLQEQILIQHEVSMPLMLQVHGVEYIAASKRKLLTNYKEASQVDFDISLEGDLILKAKDSSYEFQIYEDEKGTHIFSQTRLYMLDLYNHFHQFDYIYIETFMMSEEEAREVVSIYSDALKSYQQGSYERYVKEYMELLYRLKTPLDRGFLFDQTVYKLEDMRKMDNEKSESNH